MTITDLMNDLNSRGVGLRIEDGRLKVDAPKGIFTQELRTMVTAHKSEILALLAQQVPKTTDEADMQSTTETQPESQIEHFLPLLLKATSPPAEVPSLVRLPSAKIAANILDDVARSLAASINSNDDKAQQPVQFEFKLTIQHAGARDEISFGKKRGPIEISKVAVSSISEILPQIKAAMEDKRLYSPILALINPSWNWELRVFDICT